METPLWLPEQRALVFADALTAADQFHAHEFDDIASAGHDGHASCIAPAPSTATGTSATSACPCQRFLNTGAPRMRSIS